MSTSKGAKRHFLAWNQAMWRSPRNQRYMMPQRMMIDLDAKPKADPKLVSAATEAMEILVRNGEAANAKLQTVPEVEGDPITPDTQGSPEHGVHSEQETGTGSQEGGPFGSFGGGQ